MSSMSEKSLPSSKLLSFVITLSIILLISSSLSLREFGQNSFIPESVLQLVLVNNSSVIPSSHAEVEISPIKKFPSSEDTLRGQESGAVSISDNKNVGDEMKPLLRVYMYDLPPKFHFGLSGWEGSGNETWPSLRDEKRIPSYPGGLNLQHSTEYWLTLHLLASTSGCSEIGPCSAVRVANSSEADVIFIPFFSSLSYNRHSKNRGRHKASNDRLLQEELVSFLQRREEWKRFGGRDHLIVAHHPNSMLFARERLSSCMFILADFGRYSSRTANIDKDVIAPYKHMVRKIPAADSPAFDGRPTLAYFQGAIYRKDGGIIRQEIYYLLKNEHDVHFAAGSAQGNGVRDAGRGMALSKFCLNIAGDTPSSNRLFDAIATHCVPVIVSDEIELPYEDVVDYSEFCVFIRAADAVKKGYVVNLLRSIKREQWTKMWERLKNISEYFEYQFPSRTNDAVDMIWQAVARKKMPTLLNVHRKNRSVLFSSRNSIYGQTAIDVNK